MCVSFNGDAFVVVSTIEDGCTQRRKWLGCTQRVADPCLGFFVTVTALSNRK